MESEKNLFIEQNRFVEVTKYFNDLKILFAFRKIILLVWLILHNIWLIQQNYLISKHNPLVDKICLIEPKIWRILQHI